MARMRTLFAVVALVSTVAACGGDTAREDEDAEIRDLTLTPAEPIATIGDEPEPEPVKTSPQPTATRPRARQPEPKREPKPRRPEPEPVLSLAAGTVFTVTAQDTLTSRHNKIGDPVSARLREGVRDESGKLVIPPGAVFLGTISDVAPAESPGGEGRMVLTFDRVEFAGQAYEVRVRLDSIATRMKGRGVTAGDAAKVGAGAVVGGIAGRLLGGNKGGTVVGAVAGAGVAAAFAVFAFSASRPCLSRHGNGENHKQRASQT